ncbi:MAG TPA: hypothetical protein VF715_10975 [Thermoleophilaceae bacterium]|jgi:hypothetical protein
MKQDLRESPATRRGFLITGGAVAAGAATAAVPSLTAAESATRLSPAQRATYRALVETTAKVPGTLADARRSRQAVATLDREYRRAPDHVKARIAATLDGLDAAAKGSFARLSSKRRLAVLTADDGRAFGGLVRQAVSLAAAPFHPKGFRWDGEAAALWLRIVDLRSD